MIGVVTSLLLALEPLGLASLGDFLRVMLPRSSTHRPDEFPAFHSSKSISFPTPGDASDQGRNMRRPSACRACRARRRKCNYPNGNNVTKCVYCLTRGLLCTQEPPEGGYYAQRQAKQQAASDQARKLSSAPHADVFPNHEHRVMHPTLPPIAFRLDLVGLYFDFIHDQFHSMFHRRSFTEDVAHDRVPAILLFAMFALSSRFSDDPVYAGTDPRDRGEGYRLAAESLLTIRTMTPTMVQACVLLGAYAAGSGDTHVENLYYGLAGRMCLALNLPDRPVANSVERELNIRVWWTICMVDVWSSTAVRLPSIMPVNKNVPLPIDEIPFSSMSTDPTPGLIGNPPTRATPLLAEMIKLNRLLAKIVDLNSKCVMQQLEGEALISNVQALSNEMQHWLESLPPHMRDTPENFQWFASMGLGRFFAAVYLGYYHYGQLLHYQFLGAQASTATSAYAEDCKHHAIKLCELVYRSLAMPGSEVLYSAVSHILVIASTVQIHTLLFSGDESQIRRAKTRLERNFEILLQLRSYWPSVDSAMSRLRAFHQTCLRSNETSFLLDRWLLRFLVEFAPDMQLEPRENDPNYEALLALSKQSPVYTQRDY